MKLWSDNGYNRSIRTVINVESIKTRENSFEDFVELGFVENVRL